MSSSLSKKLGIKNGMTVALISAPDDVKETLLALLEGARLQGTTRAESSDAVLFFAQDSAALDDSLESAVRATKPGGLLWIAYPKGGKKAGTDLNRDILRQYLEAQNFAGVTLISVDDRWSAMRFRPTVEVGR
ncbi:DUF3052 domain-containing protein [Micromonospora sp. CPCC 205371]|nr:DUF3052 domain-containing protein [Micromonospora sp. CPCC 205371]